MKHAIIAPALSLLAAASADAAVDLIKVPARTGSRTDSPNLVCQSLLVCLALSVPLQATAAGWPLTQTAPSTAIAASGRTDIDLELVLAVDASGSMSKAELLVQKQGYVDALRHPEVISAIAFRGGIAIAYVEWAGPDEQRIVVPWAILSDAADTRRFADRLASAPLTQSFPTPPWRTGTSIARALLFAAGMFSTGTGANRTIDISGNGPNNSGGLLAPVRRRLIADGITINGLPIARLDGRRTPSIFPLGAYYEDCVIGGPGAFAIAVDNPAQFATAIRRKLMLEIAEAQEGLVPVAFLESEPNIDCMARENGQESGPGHY